MAEIALDRATRRFPDGTLGVDDLSLQIIDGEFMVLCGEERVVVDGAPAKATLDELHGKIEAAAKAAGAQYPPTEATPGPASQATPTATATASPTGAASPSPTAEASPSPTG